MVKRIYHLITLVAFVCTSVMPGAARAQGLALPQAGIAFTPALMSGLRIDARDPFKFNFLLDPGGAKMDEAQSRAEYDRLIKYFLAALTTPNTDMWVNLSPYEGERMIADNFSKTEMGRDLLEQDYLLKQMTAALMYPENEGGREFWRKVYEKAYAQFKTTDVAVDTFNKVWIVPQKAVVYEKNGAGMVVESHLKVMLESDYLAERKAAVGADFMSAHISSRSPVQELSKDITREVIIPILEEEVNTGKYFAGLRQIYSSMILATWFKQSLKNTLVGQVYSDRSRVKGVDISDPAAAKEEIFRKYLEAYKTGAFNLIKEEKDPASGELIPRKYFSGGALAPSDVTVTSNPADAAMMSNRRLFVVATALVLGTASALIVRDMQTRSPSAAVQEEAREDAAGTQAPEEPAASTAAPAFVPPQPAAPQLIAPQGPVASIASQPQQAITPPSLVTGPVVQASGEEPATTVPPVSVTPPASKPVWKGQLGLSRLPALPAEDWVNMASGRLPDGTVVTDFFPLVVNGQPVDVDGQPLHVRLIRLLNGAAWRVQAFQQNGRYVPYLEYGQGGFDADHTWGPGWVTITSWPYEWTGTYAELFAWADKARKWGADAGLLEELLDVVRTHQKDFPNDQVVLSRGEKNGPATVTFKGPGDRAQSSSVSQFITADFAQFTSRQKRLLAFLVMGGGLTLWGWNVLDPLQKGPEDVQSAAVETQGQGTVAQVPAPQGPVTPVQPIPDTQGAAQTALTAPLPAVPALQPPLTSAPAAVTETPQRPAAPLPVPGSVGPQGMAPITVTPPSAQTGTPAAPQTGFTAPPLITPSAPQPQQAAETVPVVPLPKPLEVKARVNLNQSLRLDVNQWFSVLATSATFSHPEGVFLSGILPWNNEQGVQYQSNGQPLFYRYALLPGGERFIMPAVLNPDGRTYMAVLEPGQTHYTAEATRAAGSLDLTYDQLERLLRIWENTGGFMAPQDMAALRQALAQQVVAAPGRPVTAAWDDQGNTVFAFSGEAAVPQGPTPAAAVPQQAAPLAPVPAQSVLAPQPQASTGEQTLQPVPSGIGQARMRVRLDFARMDGMVIEGRFPSEDRAPWTWQEFFALMKFMSDRQLLNADDKARLFEQATRQQTQFSQGQLTVTLGEDLEVTFPGPADRAQTSDPVGGINLDETLMNLEIRRDADGVALPVELQDPALVERLRNIEGLSPVIRQIMPVNFTEFFSVR
jgi:hypothetical protein